MKQKQIRDYVLEARLAKEHTNEATQISDRKIEFDTFGGCIDIYAGIGGFGKPVIELGLNSSSRGSIYFDKKINGDLDEAAFRNAIVQGEKDRKEIINALKPICNDFDNKIKALLKKYGYELRK